MRRLGIYALLIMAALLTLVGCQVPGTGLPDDGPPVAVSQEAADSLQQKLLTAGQEVATTGSTTVSLTQEEVTSFLTLRRAELEALAQEQSGTTMEFPLVDPQVYFKDDGNIVIRGQIDFQGATQPIRVVAQPTLSNGELLVDVTEGRIGPVPVPGAILDQIDQAVTQAIVQGQQYGEITDVQVSGGTLTFTGQNAQQ